MFDMLFYGETGEKRIKFDELCWRQQDQQMESSKLDQLDLFNIY